MNPAGKFATKARIVELASVSVRDERRQALALRQLLSKSYVDAFQSGSRPEALDNGGRHVFAAKWTAVSRAFGSCIKKLRKVLKYRSRRCENNARDDVRIGPLRESGDLDWHLEISERNPQIEERRTTADDQFAIKWIDICEAAGAIGTNEQLITIDDESPGLSVVAGWRLDSVTDSKACLVYGCPQGRNTRWIDIPGCKIASSHVPTRLNSKPRKTRE